MKDKSARTLQEAPDFLSDGALNLQTWMCTLCVLLCICRRETHTPQQLPWLLSLSLDEVIYLFVSSLSQELNNTRKVMVIDQEHGVCHLKQPRNANCSTDHFMRKYHYYKTKTYTSLPPLSLLLNFKTRLTMKITM